MSCDGYYIYISFTMSDRIKTGVVKTTLAHLGCDLFTDTSAMTARIQIYAGRMSKNIADITYSVQLHGSQSFPQISHYHGIWDRKLWNDLQDQVTTQNALAFPERSTNYVTSVMSILAFLTPLSSY